MSKEKTLNAHISESRLAPRWVLPRTLQICCVYCQLYWQGKAYWILFWSKWALCWDRVSVEAAAGQQQPLLFGMLYVKNDWFFMYENNFLCFRFLGKTYLINQSSICKLENYGKCDLVKLMFINGYKTKYSKGNHWTRNIFDLNYCWSTYRSYTFWNGDLATWKRRHYQAMKMRTLLCI